MADQAKQRLQAVSDQLKPINKVAPGSSTARVQGKVIIITGSYTGLPFMFSAGH